MELRDFIVTPIVLIIVYLMAYWLRPRFTDINTKRYFIPALTVRIIGALAVGFLYQFYYDGGDTYNYHTRGSTHIWDAIMTSPRIGLKLLLANGNYDPEAFKYSSKILFYNNSSSYFIVKIAALFDLLTFRTYSATAVLFATLSFTGMWKLYQVFYRRYPDLHLLLAFAIFFTPSVFFWGSGIFKDTITLAALGWATYGFDQFFFVKKRKVGNVIILLISFFLIFSIKKYILLCFLPALIIWVYFTFISTIRSLLAKVIISPIIIIICFGLAFLAILKVAEDDPKFALDKIAQTAKITAYDIAFVSGKGGSTYNLGVLDGTFQSMLNLAPQAINATLFRPYLWEVNNPLMLISALESLTLLILTLVMLFRTRIVGIFRSKSRPIAFFCLAFSLVFAFAVGVSTFNFGTLVRYKIPIMPFYICFLVILLQKKNSSNN